MVLQDYEFSPAARAGRITGTVVNQGTQPLVTVAVVFRLFDEAGTDVGETSAVCEVLQANGSWGFSAPVYEGRAVRCELKWMGSR
jgi:hypothetical protein